MKRLSIITLIFLLFLCGWSGVLAATFCPHIGAQGAQHACCLMNNEDAHDSASHHNEMAMDGMKMESSSPCATAQNETVKTIRRDLKNCEHCAESPQRGTAPLFTAGTIGQSRRMSWQTPAPVFNPRVLLASLFAPPVLSRPFAPPGSTYPRHVLISVFRI